MILEGDMEHGIGKAPLFDGTNYPYWMIRMSAHLSGIDWRVWEIVENADYEVLAAHVGQEQIDQHNANRKACSFLFLSVSLSEFESL